MAKALTWESEQTNFRFCGNSLRLTDCAILFYAPVADENDSPKPRSLFGYLHHSMPAQRQRKCVPNHRRLPRVDYASRLFSIWLREDCMQNFQNRRIVCALLAVAQRTNVDRMRLNCSVRQSALN